MTRGGVATQASHHTSRCPASHQATVPTPSGMAHAAHLSARRNANRFAMRTSDSSGLTLPSVGDDHNWPSEEDQVWRPMLAGGLGGSGTSVAGWLLEEGGPVGSRSPASASPGPPPAGEPAAIETATALRPTRFVQEWALLAYRCNQQQNACMASVTIRDVPDETRDELAARAARSGRSLQEYLRLELIELARRPDPATLLHRVQQRKARTGSKLDPATILALRDGDRR